MKSFILARNRGYRIKVFDEHDFDKVNTEDVYKTSSVKVTPTLYHIHGTDHDIYCTCFKGYQIFHVLAISTFVVLQDGFLVYAKTDATDIKKGYEDVYNWIEHGIIHDINHEYISVPDTFDKIDNELVEYRVFCPTVAFGLEHNFCYTVERSIYNLLVCIAERNRAKTKISEIVCCHATNLFTGENKIKSTKYRNTSITCYTKDLCLIDYSNGNLEQLFLVNGLYNAVNHIDSGYNEVYYNGYCQQCKAIWMKDGSYILAPDDEMFMTWHDRYPVFIYKDNIYLLDACGLQEYDLSKCENPLDNVIHSEFLMPFPLRVACTRIYEFKDYGNIENIFRKITGSDFRDR